MKHKILSLLVLCVIALSGAAQTTFEQAGAMYNAQRYADAVALYDSIEVSEGVSPELYYNRGNAYYKMGKYAPAIINYERALLLDPGNANAKYNLELVNTKITDKIEQTGTFFINVWAEDVRDWFPSNTWAVIAVVTFSKTHDNAIVFAPEVSVKSSPADSGTDLFVLHEGTKVVIQEQVGSWVEVVLSDGNRGWLPVSTIEVI